MDFTKETSLTFFSSDGKLEQCDNALQAAINGTLSVGACASDGIVLASLKIFSPLVEKSKVRKVFQVCETIGMTYSGLQPDFYVIYEEACKLVEDYKEVYGRYPFVDIFVYNLSRTLQEYTQKEANRPFGTLLLISGPMLKKSETSDFVINNEIIAGLFRMDPSGSFQAIKCGAIGKEYLNATKHIETRLEMTDDNLVICVTALKEHANTKISFQDVDIGVYLVNENVFKVYSVDEVKEVFESMPS